MSCCKKKQNGSEVTRIIDPYMEQQIKSKTSFTPEEIERFYLYFKSLASQGGDLQFEGFQKLLKIMGITISQRLEARMYNVVDINRQEKIDFPEIMIFFNTILRGTKEQQILFTHRLIDGKQKGYFTGTDLENLIWDIDQPEHSTEKEEQEHHEKVHILAASMIEGMDCSFDEKISLDKFKQILDQNEQIYIVFKGLGSDISNLLDVHGHNEYTVIVKVLEDLYRTFSAIQRQKKLGEEYREIIINDKDTKYHRTAEHFRQSRRQVAYKVDGFQLQKASSGDSIGEMMNEARDDRHLNGGGKDRDTLKSIPEKVEGKRWCYEESDVNSKRLHHSFGIRMNPSQGVTPDPEESNADVEYSMRRLSDNLPHNLGQRPKLFENIRTENMKKLQETTQTGKISSTLRESILQGKSSPCFTELL